MTEIALAALFVGFAFLAAGVVKGVVGLGLPTVAIGVLSLAMSPSAAAAMLIVPSLVTNVWQTVAGPHLRSLSRRLAPLLATIVFGTMSSISVLTGESAGIANGVLGAVLIVYSATGLFGVRFSVPPGAQRWLSPLVGFLTGLVAGTTGVFALPLIPYLNSIGLAKDELMQALGLAFTVSTLGLAAALAMTGDFRLASAGGSLLAVIPALLGMLVGQRLRSRIEPEAFRRWFFIGLIVLGAYMLGRSLLRA